MHVHTPGSQRNAQIKKQQSTSNLGLDIPSGLHLFKLEQVFDVYCKSSAPFPKLENCCTQAMFFLLQEPTKNPTISKSEQ